MVMTCNPDPDWFALEWIKPYLLEDGTPNREMDGVIRYFKREGNDLVWASTREELEEVYGTGEDSGIQSFSFISANLLDNIPLMKADPGYLGRLKSLPYVQMMRDLYGNWYIRPSGSNIMKREWFVEQPDYPSASDIVKTVRAFDFAGSLKSDSYPSPDYTACVKMAKLKDGTYIILDVVRTRVLFGDWVKFILDCCANDEPNTDVVIPIDPNPSAKAASDLLARTLTEHGLYVRRFRATNKKIDRARPFASMLMNGGVRIVKGCCTDLENNTYNDNNFFYREIDSFDGERRKGENGHDDMVDGASDSFMALAQKTYIPNIGSALSSLNLTNHNPLVN